MRKFETLCRLKKQLMVALLLSTMMVPVLAQNEAEARLQAQAEDLIAEIDTLQSDAVLPYLSKEALAKAQAFLAESQEARKRRNYGASASSLDNAELELTIARRLARIGELEDQKQGLEAVVAELSQKVDADRGDNGGSDD